MRNAIKGGANRCSNIMRGNATEVNQHGEGWARPLSYYSGGVTKSTSLSPEHCDWTQPHKSPSSEVRIRCKVELLHQLLREAVNLPPGQNFGRKITSKTFRPESHEKCRLMSMKVHWLQGVELHWSSSSINAGQNITSAGLGNKMVSSYFSIHKHMIIWQSIWSKLASWSYSGITLDIKVFSLWRTS